MKCVSILSQEQWRKIDISYYYIMTKTMKFFQLNILIIDKKILQRMDAKETFEGLLHHGSNLEECLATQNV